MSDWAKGLTLFNFKKSDKSHFDKFENKHELVAQHFNFYVWFYHSRLLVFGHMTKDQAAAPQEKAVSNPKGQTFKRAFLSIAAANGQTFLLGN